MTSGDGVKEHTGVEPEKGEPRMKDKCQRFVGRNNVKSSDRTPRPTITTRQRVEQAVEKFARQESYCVGSDILYREDVVKFILAERRRIRREVKKMRDEATVSKFVGSRDAATYRNACDDMLARLRG